MRQLKKSIEELFQQPDRNGMRKDPIIELYKRDVDRSLLRENLKLTVTQRFEKLMEMQRFAAELRRAGKEASRNAGKRMSPE
jgi:hypothetical protein